MTEQERLFRRISAFRFSMWELHMFLDTHPNNCDAAKKLEEYRLKTDELTKKYEAEFGQLPNQPLGVDQRPVALGKRHRNGR